MVLGFCLLALKAGLNVSSFSDAEMILPRVLTSEFFPPGIRGGVIAAMMAAAMSIFDSTLNAGASYIVRDIYSPLQPRASPRVLVYAGYVASVLIMAVSVAIALSWGSSVLSIWVGIVMLLFPAFLVPFVLRWFWSRFNGYGFFAGILSGFATAAWLSLARPQTWGEATRFLAIAAVSTIFSVAITLITAPTGPAMLRLFFEKIRPFGAWPKAWKQLWRAEHREDQGTLLAALTWQVLTFLLPMGGMLRMWKEVAVSSVVWIVLAAWLWRGTRRNANGNVDPSSVASGEEFSSSRR